MARKKNSKTPQKDRHKPRRMIGVPVDVHEQFKLLAARRERSLAREIKRLMIEELKKEGLWPPPGQ